MNDFDPSLDEIVSAYVDDAATPTERALVEGDPALVERAATFRRLRAEIATPPAPADDELRRTLIARAMADSAVAGGTEQRGADVPTHRSWWGVDIHRSPGRAAGDHPRRRTPRRRDRRRELRAHDVGSDQPLTMRRTSDAR